jgi:hypothetical protein
MARKPVQTQEPQAPPHSVRAQLIRSGILTPAALVAPRVFIHDEPTLRIGRVFIHDEPEPKREPRWR